VASDRDTEAGIRAAILEHVERWPGAADTASGIATWWLPRLGINVSREEVARVLEDLVAEGIMQIRSLPDGAKLYGPSAAACDRDDT